MMGGSSGDAGSALGGEPRSGDGAATIEAGFGIFIYQPFSFILAHGFHGLTRGMPVWAKSETLRVARVRPWTWAVAAMRESL